MAPRYSCPPTTWKDRFSNWPIEKEPTEGIGLDGWIFGCDRCQSCCPHNQKAPMHTNPAFDPVFDPLAMDAEAWLAMDETEFEARMGTTFDVSLEYPLRRYLF